MSTPAEASSPFWNWLQHVKPHPKSLAWCHTTDGFVFRQMVKDRHFRPQACPVFKEELLYFFYGRPAYRFNEASATRISSRAPVVLILDPDVVSQGKRMFPFDSGAFAAKRYSAWIHERMAMSDFELACPSDAAQRHVASFFGSNMNYMRMKAQAPNETIAGEFEAESILALLTDPSNKPADDRRTALELQTAVEIPLTPPSVRGLILPDELLEAQWVKQFLDETTAGKLTVLPYFQGVLKPAIEYQALLESHALEMQKEWGLV